MEKVVNEVRVIETDDGFRIEIKGDKDQIKAFMSGLGKHRAGPHWHGRHRGGFPFPPWMWMKAAACRGMWDFEAEEGEENEAASKV
jgi:hypothetical protein